MSPEATDDTTTSHSISNDFNIDLPLHLSISPTPVPVMQDLLIWKPWTARTHVCLNCSKRFSHQYTLDRHLKTVCGKVRNTNGKWKCESCNRTYESQGSLSRHYRFECHVDPQFPCVFCKKLFTQKCSLNRHLNRKHRKEEILAFLPVDMDMINEVDQQQSAAKAA